MTRLHILKIGKLSTENCNLVKCCRIEACRCLKRGSGGAQVSAKMKSLIRAVSVLPISTITRTKEVGLYVCKGIFVGIKFISSGHCLI